MDTSLPPDFDDELETALETLSRIERAVDSHRRTSVHRRLLTRLENAEDDLRSLQRLLVTWEDEVAVGAQLSVTPIGNVKGRMR